MGRIFFAGIALAIVMAATALHWVGINPLGLAEAMRVGTGMTAKLGCSGLFLSGFSEEEIQADLASYSPAANAVTLRREGSDRVSADIQGMAGVSARYIPGLGCSLEFADALDRDKLRVPSQGEAQQITLVPDRNVQDVLDRVLEEDARAGLDTRALLVMRGGAVIAEAYREGIDAQTPLLGWSMAKSVTAMLLGRMEAMGLVDPASTGLFPEWSGDARADIHLSDMLQMSSGLAFEEVYAPGSDATRMLFTVADASAIALEKEAEHLPGEYFSYSSGTSNLLMRYARQQLGGEPQALLDFWRAQLSGPLGLAATTFELDASGVFVGSSYLYAPARDWARMGQLMLDDGEVAGQRLLPAGWVARAQAPNSSENEPRYGYQFWLNAGGSEPRWADLEQGAYAMMGNRGQIVMMLPQHRAVIVRLGWSATDYPSNDRLGRIQAAL